MRNFKTNLISFSNALIFVFNYYLWLTSPLNFKLN